MSRALNSAVDQDPDLDLLSVYLKLEQPRLDLEMVPPWPATRPTYEWEIGEASSIDTTPAYLLIGPDLTVHAYRGALSDDPDGIKPVIRGVAEIRKKVASPQLGLNARARTPRPSPARAAMPAAHACGRARR